MVFDGFYASLVGLYVVTTKGGELGVFTRCGDLHHTNAKGNGISHRGELVQLVLDTKPRLVIDADLVVCVWVLLVSPVMGQD